MPRKAVNTKPVELGKVSENAVVKGEKFIDAMIADGQTYVEIIQNFRRLLFKRVIASEGNVSAAARALKTDANVIFECIRSSQNRAYFAVSK